MEKHNKTTNPAPPTGGLQGASTPPPTGGLQGAEVWKVIPDFPRYEVSNMGRVRSNCCKDGRKVRYVLKAYLRSNGYLCVDLSISGRKSRKVMAVHRLVARAFIGERPEGYVIDHINGDRWDNRVQNLRYVTCSENLRSKHTERFKDGFRIEIFRDGIFFKEVKSRCDLLKALNLQIKIKQGGASLNALFVNGRTWRYKNFYAVLVLPSDDVESGPAPHVQFRFAL